MRIEFDIGGQAAVLLSSGLTVDGVSYAPDDQMPDDPDTPEWIMELPDQQTVADAVAAVTGAMFAAAMESRDVIEARVSAWRDQHGAWSPGDDEPPLNVSRGRIIDAAKWAQAALLCLWARSVDCHSITGVEVHEERDQLHGIYRGSWIVGARVRSRLHYWYMQAREDAEQVAAALSGLLGGGWTTVEWTLTPAELPAHLVGETPEWASYRLDVSGRAAANLVHCPMSRSAVLRCEDSVITGTATTPVQAVQYFLRGTLED
jgi:hypothetical protein